MKNKWLKGFLLKHGVFLCNLALVAAISAGESCRFIVYEPKEPEGLGEFIDKGKKQAM